MKPYNLTKLLILQFLLIFLLSATTKTLPTDMLENLLWGKDLAFGYDKHPPFFAWESYLFVKLFGGNLLFYHLLTPINQIILILFSYLIVKETQGKEKALLAAIFIQGIITYVFYYKFNGNTANFAFFGAIYYVFHKIINKQNYKLLPILATLCGIVMLIKYSALLLIGTLGFIILFTKEGRKVMKSIYFIPSIIIFLLIIAPNLYDVFINKNNGAIKYFTEQSTETNYSFLKQILRFIFNPIILCLPFLIALFFTYKKINRQKNLNFWLLVCFLPFIATFSFIIFFKGSVGTFWLSMFFAPFVITSMFLFDFKKDALKIAIKIIYSINIFLYLIYLLAAFAVPEDDTKKIAEFVQEVKQKHNVNSNYFICNETRRMCGLVIIYGTDYSKISMPLSKWKKNFESFNELKEKPENFIIIGAEENFSISGYNVYIYKKEIPKYHKFKFFENLFKNPPKFLIKDFKKLENINPIILQVAIKKHENT